MTQTTVYSMLRVTATLDGRPVQGLFDGDDAIMVEEGADIGTLLVGADGEAIFSQSANRSARITLKLMHTSPTHRQLMEKLKRQRAGRVIGFPFDVIDSDTREGGTADRCFIHQAPADTKGTNATVRTWVLITGQYEHNVPFGAV